MELQDSVSKFIKKLGNYFNILNPLHKNGQTNKEIDKKSNIRVENYNGIEWVDIENPKHDDLDKLIEKYGFHSLHTEASISTGELDRVEQEEKYIFILVHSPSFDHAEQKIVARQICLFVGKDYVVTIHKGHRRTISDIFTLFESNNELKENFFRKSSSRLLHSILTLFEKDVSNLLHSILQEVEDIEDVVFDVNISGIYRISRLRQKIVKLRRVALSFREVAEDLVKLQNSLILKSNRYFKDLANNFNKLFEVLEETKETIEIYKDADFTVSTEKTNKILTVLTIVFTLSIPATLMGAIYGMNVLLPGGLDAGSWTFLGEFTTFYLLIGGSIVSVLMMLVFFKYKDWF